MHEMDISLCLITEGQEAGHLSIILEDSIGKLKSQGEVIVVGDLQGFDIPKGVKAIFAPNEAQSRRRGRLRNLAISQSQGRIIICGDSTAFLGPSDWPARIIQWARPIPEGLPFVFGFKIISPRGERLWDWICVDEMKKVASVDYGERVGGLAVGAGYLGLSRAAWDLSDGFWQEGLGPGEEIEFSSRCVREKKLALIFCDAIFAVRSTEPKRIQKQEHF